MQIDIIGVPIDLGADRRGVDMGPSAIRYAHLQRKLEDLGYTVNDEGQKKYQVKELEFVWNPITSQPIVAAVTFTEKSIWKWAKWDFYKIAKMEPAIPGDVKTNLLDANGQLLAKFKGAEILDYR